MICLIPSGLILCLAFGAFFVTDKVIVNSAPPLDRDEWDDNRLLQNNAAFNHLADLMNELRRDSLCHHGI